MKKNEPHPSEQRGEWQDVGFCGFCLLSIEAKQPGGRELRHKSTLTPYGQCNQAIKARQTKKE